MGLSAGLPIVLGRMAITDGDIRAITALGVVIMAATMVAMVVGVILIIPIPITGIHIPLLHAILIIAKIRVGNKVVWLPEIVLQALLRV